MKITAARTIVCCPGRNFVTLKVETDQGLSGIGDATLNGRELAVASYLDDHVIPCLIGRDPHQIEDIWQYLYRGAYWRRGPVTMSAIAAVDTALWDWRCKRDGQPLWRAAGGAQRSAAHAHGARGDLGATPFGVAACAGFAAQRARSRARARTHERFTARPGHAFAGGAAVPGAGASVAT